MEWNDETIARLRTLWDEGLSTAEIGRRLGVSKNAVVGKAHRLALPARPSPIRRDGAAPARAAAPRRVTGPTLPPLPAGWTDAPEAATAGASTKGALPAAGVVPVALVAARPAMQPAMQATPQRTAVGAASVPVEMAVPTPQPIRVVPPAAGRHTACCWPLGEPGTRSFRFCDAASLPGKPYCGEHAQIAYVKVRDRREEAA